MLMPQNMQQNSDLRFWERQKDCRFLHANVWVVTWHWSRHHQGRLLFAFSEQPSVTFCCAASLSYIWFSKARYVTVSSLAPERGPGGLELAFRRPESARKVHAKSFGQKCGSGQVVVLRIEVDRDVGARRWLEARLGLNFCV